MLMTDGHQSGMTVVDDAATTMTTPTSCPNGHTGLTTMTSMVAVAHGTPRIADGTPHIRCIGNVSALRTHEVEEGPCTQVVVVYLPTRLSPCSLPRWSCRHAQQQKFITHSRSKPKQ
ncbi:hypothetical protein PR202_ga21246 [Eleusine coracana subsp. coracana]|uniref:Uncharacterized protein n=1 Tax=Eleusine coracana subsp. coracana TaxID=191504 RepID=A0AAV5D0C4_ELECO|nr:hypothetical protein PR202_ga21246 [Eleusine coracana subsp. coracana]